MAIVEALQDHSMIFQIFIFISIYPFHHINDKNLIQG